MIRDSSPPWCFHFDIFLCYLPRIANCENLAACHHMQWRSISTGFTTYREWVRGIIPDGSHLYGQTAVINQLLRVTLNLCITARARCQWVFVSLQCTDSSAFCRYPQPHMYVYRGILGHRCHLQQWHFCCLLPCKKQGILQIAIVPANREIFQHFSKSRLHDSSTAGGLQLSAVCHPLHSG